MPPSFFQPNVAASLRRGARPAALIPPRRLRRVFEPAEVLAAVGFDRRADHRAFIVSDSRLRPAGVKPLPRPRGSPLRRVPVDEVITPAPSSSSASMALPIRSRSLLSSDNIRSISNVGLLWELIRYRECLFILPLS